MIRKFKNIPFLKFKTNSKQEMYSKRPHSHNEVSLGYIESGKTTITVLNQKYQLLPGDSVLIPSETVHICIPEDVSHFRFQMIYFDKSWWKRNFTIPSESFKTLAIPLPGDLKSLIFQISEKSLDVKTMEEELIHSINKVIEKYELQNTAINPWETEIDRIHHQIRQMPQITMSIEQMAEQAGINKYSFIRRYAGRYGLTPHADIINMRIQRSILLFETDMDLTTIALECGFSDQSHFINQFKLYSGLRPQEYRQALK
jgi:AraC-like DNA-binding protein